MSDTLLLAKELIRRPSITPNDLGCQLLIAERLRKLNFHIEHMQFGEVDNLWARKGTQSPLVVLAGHTDVVPPGPLDAWSKDPFEPYVREGLLYGRGAADMKGGLSAMIVAAEKFLQAHPTFKGSIAFLITSDEEGATNINGTQRVIAELVNRGEKIDYCLIAEASSNKKAGDQIRIGRRGSLSGKLTIHGKQGHVAFPELAKNPIHLFAAALCELTETTWDMGNEYFPATTFQVSNIQSGLGALNIIPASLQAFFNFRFSTASTADILQKRVALILKKHGLHFDLDWSLTGHPFLTAPGALITAVKEAIQTTIKLDPILSTGGGTSDGRFIAPTGAQVVELGPCNASVHQADEHVSVIDLEKLTDTYQVILEKLLVRVVN